MAHNTPKGQLQAGTSTKSLLDYVNFAKGGVNAANAKTLSNTSFSKLKDFWRQYVNTGGDPSNTFPDGLTAVNSNISFSHFKNAQYFEAYIAAENYDHATSILSPVDRYYIRSWKAILFISLKHPDSSSLVIGPQTYTSATYPKYLFDSSNGSDPHYLEVGVKSGSSYVGEMFKGTDRYDVKGFELDEISTTNPAIIKPGDVLNSTNSVDLSLAWVGNAGTYTLELIARSYATGDIIATGNLTVTMGTGPTGAATFTGTTTCCTDGAVHPFIWSSHNTEREEWPSDWHVITLGKPCMKIDVTSTNCLRRCGSIFSVVTIPTQ